MTVPTTSVVQPIPGSAAPPQSGISPPATDGGSDGKPLPLTIQGMYRDTVRDARTGRILYESEWRHNVIVTDCRRVLTAFLRGAPSNALGIQGLQVGMGDPAWDTGGPPAPTAGITKLTDNNPHTVPRAGLVMDFLAGDVISGTPTTKLQIVANLPAGVPAWPDGTHTANTLREFGLIASLDGTTVLLNCVRHPAIVRDASSSLERRIWLTL